MPDRWLLAAALIGLLLVPRVGLAQAVEDQNGCQGTTDDPCVRVGSCSIQGSVWTQTVTIARSDLYDTMGWPGLCDQVHVALVQGNCAPGGEQVNVTVYLQASSIALLPQITGPLVCNAAPAPGIPLAGAGVAGVMILMLGATGLWAARRRGSRTCPGEEASSG